MADAGRTITGGNVAGFNAGFPATIIAYEKVGARMREAGAPPAGWPQDTYFVDSKDLFVNGEAVQIFTNRPRTAMATAWCSSAGRMW